MIIVGLDRSRYKHDFVIMNPEVKIIASPSAAGQENKSRNWLVDFFCMPEPSSLFLLGLDANFQ